MNLKILFLLFIFINFSFVFSLERLTNDTKINDDSYLKSNPQVLFLDNGNLIFIWSSLYQDGSGWGIFGQFTNTNLTKIGQEFRINDFGIDSQSNQIAIKSNGGFLVVWESNYQDLSHRGIYLRFFDNNGNKLGFEKIVNTYTTHEQYEPSVAKLNNGKYIVTWTSFGQNISNQNDIYGQIIDEQGNKIGMEFQVFNTINKKRKSSVTGLLDGSYVVVCEGDHNGIYGVIMMQMFNEKNEKVNGITIVNSFLSQTARNPKVISLDNGNYVVAWENIQDGSGYGIYIQIFNINNQKIETELQINTITVNNQENVFISQLTNGFIVNWNDNYVYGRIYDNYGNIQSNQINLSNNTNIYKYYPASYKISSNKFVSVWYYTSNYCCDNNIISNVFNYNIPTSTSQTIPTSTSQTIPTSTSQTIPTSISQTIPTSTSQTIPTSTSQTIPTSTSQMVPIPIPPPIQQTIQTTILSNSNQNLTVVPQNDNTLKDINFSTGEFIGLIIGLVMCVFVIVIVSIVIAGKIAKKDGEKKYNEA